MLHQITNGLKKIKCQILLARLISSGRPFHRAAEEVYISLFPCRIVLCLFGTRDVVDAEWRILPADPTR